MFLLVVFIYYVCYRILSSAFLFKAQCLNKETSNHTTPAGIPFQRTSHIPVFVFETESTLVRSKIVFRLTVGSRQFRNISLGQGRVHQSHNDVSESRMYSGEIQGSKFVFV